MKRFFTKKSVALIFTTILLVGLFSCNSVNALTSPTEMSAIQASTAAASLETASSTISTVFTSIFNVATGAYSFAYFTPIAGFLVLVQGVLAALTALSGSLFDLSIYFSIINLKDFFSTGGVVDMLWSMIRDLLNVCFIFILLYISIVKILGSWGIKAKTNVVNVVLSAVLINFSMFFTKILIDAGNMVAVAIYNQISSLGLVSSLSASIINGTNLLDFIKSSLTLTGQTNVIIALVLQIVCMSILLWVFFYFSIIIIGRSVMLIFLTMTSPIGFIGQSVPWLGEYSKSWWKTLIEQILVAPLMMFFLLFVIRLLQTNAIQKMITSASTPWYKTPDIDVTGFFIYILIVAILLQGLKLVKKYSGEVGAMAVKIIGTAVAAGAVAVTGGAALVSAGALSAEAGAAAQLAGKKGVSAWGSRLAFSAKNIGDTGIGKFVTGEHEKTGISGLAQTLARKEVIGGVKNMTGGVIDLGMIEKTLKNSTKEAVENVTKKADELGPKKLQGQQKQIANTLSEITKQAETRLPKDIKDQKQEFEKAKAAAEKAKTNLAEKTKEREEKEKVLVTKVQGTQEHTDAKADLDKAKEIEKTANTDFGTAETKVNNFKKYESELKAKEEEVAKEMGIAATDTMEDVFDTAGKVTLDAKGNKIQKKVTSYIETLKKESSGLEGKILAATKARNEFISSEIEGGSKLSTLLWAGDRKKLAAKLRAGEAKDIKKDFQKMMKEYNIQSEETKPKEEETEPKK